MSGAMAPNNVFLIIAPFKERSSEEFLRKIFNDSYAIHFEVLFSFREERA